MFKSMLWATDLYARTAGIASIRNGPGGPAQVPRNRVAWTKPKNQSSPPLLADRR